MTPSEKFIELLQQHPEDFVEDEHTITHKSKVSIWIKNGKSSLHFYMPHDFPMTRSEKREVWKTFRNWQARAIVATMERNSL